MGSTPGQDLFAEHQAGASEEDEVAAILAGTQDPLHQILALQNFSRPGHGPGSSGTSGGWGCVARDA